MRNHHNSQRHTLDLPKHITLDQCVYEDRYLYEYLAKDENLGREIFLQILKNQRLEKAIYDWDNVAKQSSQLLTFYETGKISNGKSYFAYILDCEGKTSSLSAIKNEISLGEAVSLFRSILQIINILHEVGYVYGSLSPDRFLVCTDTNANIISFSVRPPCHYAEFGYDMAYKRTDSDELSDNSLQIVNALYPTDFPAISEELTSIFERQKFIDAWVYSSINPFISPEYTFEKTKHSDLYSIGIMLYWLLSSKLPNYDYEKIGLSEVEKILYQNNARKFLLFRFLDSIILQKLIDPVDLSLIPSEYQDVIKKLSYSTDNKYQNIDELILDIDNIFVPKQNIVITSEQNLPIKQAHLILRDMESGQVVAHAVTDKNGQVVLGGLLRKQYTLSVTKDKYEEQKINVDIGKDNSINVHLISEKMSVFEKIKKQFSKRLRK